MDTLSSLASLVDPRTDDWFLVTSFKSVVIPIVMYFAILGYLPKVCQRYKPLKIPHILLAYNVAMMFLNLYIFQELLVNAWRLRYSFCCQPCRIVHSAEELRLASAVWWFYISKLLEFCDTLFFILRHKWEQLTALHIYHHSTMFPLWWIAVKWVPTGSTFFPALINSFVHVIMYAYYGLSACRLSVHRHLWWKKYLTGTQMVQFSITLMWAVQSIVRGCDYPLWINLTTILYMFSFLILFGRFYMQTYQSVRC